MNNEQEMINNLIETNPYPIRRAKRMYLAYTAGRLVKWTVIGVGVVAIAGAVMNRNDDDKEEN